MTLNQKETGLLQDLKKQEEVCVEKYSKYSTDAKDVQLKTLFSQIGQTEQQHLSTLNQMIGGTVPPMGGGSKQQPPAGAAAYTVMKETPEKKADAYLCSDALSTEKHVSAEYNTCLFEFSDVGIRDTLNHIQKEEQEHGKEIYDYMSKNGMYS